MLTEINQINYKNLVYTDLAKSILGVIIIATR